ncbi:MAG: MBL fold metallo-hydrolase [Acidimicrobiia bacterium]|nr:MBL fold metallo-hydrolase [Acidimicrobiia bacterium]
MKLIAPVLADDELLADIAAGADADDGRVRLWWLGQAGFLVQWHRHHLLIDPYLSNSLTTKYADTDTPHVRLTARAVDPHRLGMIEVVTSSHNHTDHLDHETLGPLRDANPTLAMVIPEANRAFVAERLRTDPAWPVGLTDGASTQLGPWRLTGLAVAHEQLETDDAGRHRHLGYVVEVGPFTLFHSGDAVPYVGMVERLIALLGGRPLHVAVLPINGRVPARRVPGNFWGDEAATFAHAVGARLVVPMHYDMFAFNTETPARFEETARALGQPHRVLRGGERLEITPTTESEDRP